MPEGFLFPQRSFVWRPLVGLDEDGKSDRPRARPADVRPAEAGSDERPGRRRPAQRHIGTGGSVSGRPTRTSRSDRGHADGDWRPHPAAARGDDGRRRVRAADRVRERREPAAGARRRPRSRGVGADVDGGQPLAHRPATADGEPAPRDASPALSVCCCRSPASGCSGARRRRPIRPTGCTSRWTGASSASSPLVCLGTSIVFGLVPALYTSKTNLTDVLNDAGRGSVGSRRGRRWSGALVAGQLALTLVLLSGAGLMVRNVLVLSTMEAGVDTSTLVRLRLDLPRQPTTRAGPSTRASIANSRTASALSPRCAHAGEC